MKLWTDRQTDRTSSMLCVYVILSYSVLKYHKERPRTYKLLAALPYGHHFSKF